MYMYMNNTCSTDLSELLRFVALQTMGFPTGVCESALRQHGTVQAAVEAILSGNGMLQSLNVYKYIQYMYQERMSLPPSPPLPEVG